MTAELKMLIKLPKNLQSRLDSVLTVLPQHPSDGDALPPTPFKEGCVARLPGTLETDSLQPWARQALPQPQKAAWSKVMPFPYGPHLTTGHGRGRKPGHFGPCVQF